jgi:hypothetical protein
MTGGDPTRQFVTESLGDPYRPFGSLREASAAPDGAVVLSGDYSGTIFLTAPARIVACSEETLTTLVSDLDAVTWMSGDPTIATVTYEAHPVGTGVAGGDGGGVVLDRVWVHPHRVPPSVAAQAAEVVLGTRSRIDVDLLRKERQRELDRKRAWREAHPPTSPRIRALGWRFDIADPIVPLHKLRTRPFVPKVDRGVARESELRVQQHPLLAGPDLADGA